MQPEYRDGMENLLQRSRDLLGDRMVAVEQGGPLFYDMTVAGEAEILYDPSGFFARFLDGLRARMAALGSRRLKYLGHDYWDLKPGDVIDL